MECVNVIKKRLAQRKVNTHSWLMAVNKTQTFTRRNMSTSTPIKNRPPETNIMHPTGTFLWTASVALMNPLQGRIEFLYSVGFFLSFFHLFFYFISNVKSHTNFEQKKIKQWNKEKDFMYVLGLFIPEQIIIIIALF